MEEVVGMCVNHLNSLLHPSWVGDFSGAAEGTRQVFSYEFSVLHDYGIIQIPLFALDELCVCVSRNCLICLCGHMCS